MVPELKELFRLIIAEWKWDLEWRNHERYRTERQGKKMARRNKEDK